MSLLMPETGLLFWMLLAFGIVFLILAKFGWPVITGMVEKRTSFINESVKSAEEANKQLENIKIETAAIIAKAHEEEVKILKEAAEMRKQIIQDAKNAASEEAKKIVESVINSGEKFNVIYAENDGMAKGAVAALDEAGITHGVNGDVVVMGFDCNKWALRELLAGNWNYDGQCSPFQAAVIENMIKTGNVTSKKVISEEKGFDAKTITKAINIISHVRTIERRFAICSSSTATISFVTLSKKARSCEINNTAPL